jgi:hypothetical protein
MKNICYISIQFAVAQLNILLLSFNWTSRTCGTIQNKQLFLQLRVFHVICRICHANRNCSNHTVKHIFQSALCYIVQWGGLRIRILLVKQWAILAWGHWCNLSLANSDWGCVLFLNMAHWRLPLFFCKSSDPLLCFGINIILVNGLNRINIFMHSAMYAVWKVKIFCRRLGFRIVC